MRDRKQVLYLLLLLLATLFAILVKARPDSSSQEDSSDNEGKKNSEYQEEDSQNYEQNVEDQKTEPSSNKNNVYESKNGNKNDYETYGEKSKNEKQKSSVQVIPQQQTSQRLEEIYHFSKGAYHQQKIYEKNETILLYWKFGRDFEEANPRNPNSLVRFTGTKGNDPSDGGPADNGAFQRIDGEEEYGSEKGKVYGKDGYLKITSVPFSKNGFQEAFVNTKQTFAVGPQERILIRAKLSCKTIDTEKNPFNITLVSHRYDDPRLGNCQLQMSNGNGTSPYFYFLFINKSVWAVYQTDTVLAKRKVGIRERYDSVIDAGIEYDRRQGAVNYYLNGYKVWTINAIGIPPPDDGITKIDAGAVSSAPPAVVTITNVSLAFGTSKCLDETDPYTSSTVRLVALQPLDSPLYGRNAVFYDPTGAQGNQTWGEGAIAKFYKVLVVKTDSKPLKLPEALPAVYGSSEKEKNDQNKYENV